MDRIENRQKKLIRDLAEKSKVRKETGLYIVDGPKMCSEIPREAIERIYVSESFPFSSNAESCRSLLQSASAVISDSEMKQISDTVTPQGILCVVKQMRKRSVSEMISAAAGNTPLLLILETIQDPGNLGTMFRAAEAAGITGIIMNDSTVDVYSPKVVRSTMGSVFRVPFAVVSDLPDCLRKLKEGVYTSGRKVSLLAACLNAELDYTSFNYRVPCGFLIGNESSGLSDFIVAETTEKVRIPMEGSVESLNAAMAATVIGFEAARQRRQGWRD